MMTRVVPDDDNRRRAYEVLFRAHYDAVARYLQARYPTADISEVMSNTFEIAWRRFDDIPLDAERGWLIGVARNCSRNSLRAARRRQAHLDALKRATIGERLDAAVSSLEREWLVTAFRKLSTSDQELLLLAEWDDLTGADLAHALGVTESAAAVRLHRARKRLRTHLDASGGER